MIAAFASAALIAGLGGLPAARHRKMVFIESESVIPWVTLRHSSVTSAS